MDLLKFPLSSTKELFEPKNSKPKKYYSQKTNNLNRDFFICFY